MNKINQINISKEIESIANEVRNNNSYICDSKHNSIYTNRDMKNCYAILVHLLSNKSMNIMLNSGEDFDIGRINLDAILYNIKEQIRKLYPDL